MTIAILQAKLGVKVTGIYNNTTMLAVKKWQEEHSGIKQKDTPLGACDKETYKGITGMEL